MNVFTHITHRRVVIQSCCSSFASTGHCTTCDVL